jgi:hypothetical protein
MGLGTTCKAETSKMKNVSIESSGWKKLCHRKIPLTITNLHMKLKSNWPLHIHSVYISLHFNIITYHLAITKYFYMQLLNMAKQNGEYWMWEKV